MSEHPNKELDEETNRRAREFFELLDMSQEEIDEVMNRKPRPLTKEEEEEMERRQALSMKILQEYPNGGLDDWEIDAESDY